LDVRAAAVSPSDFEVSVDTLRARRGNKWRHFGPDVLPAWVADMDFHTPPVVRDALVAAVERGDTVYYGDRLPEVALAWCRWQEQHHGWAPEPEATIVVDDVVSGIRGSLLAWCAGGAGAVVQTPVYPPFLESVEVTPARLVENRLLPGSPRWAIDIADLARRVDASTRVLLLCNPQNPTGRAFDRGELSEVADLSVERDLVVVSDEIWADVVYEPAGHVPFASLGREVAARTVTLSSASKTFNLGGMRCAVAHFGSPRLYDEFEARAHPYLGQSNALAVEATLAAWRHAQPWRDALLARLRANRDRVLAVVRAETPEVVVCEPEATYVAWLDFTAFGFAAGSAGPAPAEHLLDTARVALSPGAEFAPWCAPFARLNFATTPEILDDVLARYVAGVERMRAERAEP
jgi:cystathionine beta-lyase